MAAGITAAAELGRLNSILLRNDAGLIYRLEATDHQGIADDSLSGRPEIDIPTTPGIRYRRKVFS